MNNKQKQEIFKHLSDCKKMIKDIRNHLGYMDRVTIHLRSAEFDILAAIDNIKKKYQKEEPKKEDKKKEIKNIEGKNIN